MKKLARTTLLALTVLLYAAGALAGGPGEGIKIVWVVASELCGVFITETGKVFGKSTVLNIYPWC